jgi:hypothetical protein
MYSKNKTKTKANGKNGNRYNGEAFNGNKTKMKVIRINMTCSLTFKEINKTNETNETIETNKTNETN